MNTPELLQARGEIIALKFFLLNCMLLLTKAAPDPASYLEGLKDNGLNNIAAIEFPSSTRPFGG